MSGETTTSTILTPEQLAALNALLPAPYNVLMPIFTPIMVPMIDKLVDGFLSKLTGGMGTITNVATPAAAPVTAIAANPDALFAVAKSIDDVATALNRIAAALASGLEGLRPVGEKK